MFFPVWIGASLVQYQTICYPPLLHVCEPISKLLLKQSLSHFWQIWHSISRYIHSTFQISLGKQWNLAPHYSSNLQAGWLHFITQIVKCWAFRWDSRIRNFCTLCTKTKTHFYKQFMSREYVEYFISLYFYTWNKCILHFKGLSTGYLLPFKWVHQALRYSESY